jgi:CRISPR-associated protein (TIGR02710 family)
MASHDSDPPQARPPGHYLLIASVGGSSEPIVASLKYWRPDRVLFVVSPESRPEVEQRVLPAICNEGLPLGPGQYDEHPLSDGQNLQQCVQELRPLHNDIRRWLERGANFVVVVDYTGGTKSMSAALALSMHRLRCRFSYVGGSQRTKNNIGVVVSGTEKILWSPNPWETLGYQFRNDALVLFDQQAYASAVKLLEKGRNNVDSDSVKTELNALATLLKGYAEWDRFNHKAALDALDKSERNHHTLAAVLGNHTVDELLRLLPQHVALLQRLANATQPNDIVRDLLANAQRRFKEARYDDAVARLYRAIEAMAQIRLRDKYEIATDAVPIDRVPPPLGDEWRPRAVNGTVRVGLQDAYRLLDALGDDLGARFRQLDLHNRQNSPLVSRNESILAHGFRCVRPQAFETLWKHCLQLAEIDDPDAQLPQFPRLSGALPAVDPSQPVPDA